MCDKNVRVTTERKFSSERTKQGFKTDKVGDSTPPKGRFSIWRVSERGADRPRGEDVDAKEECCGESGGERKTRLAQTERHFVGKKQMQGFETKVRKREARQEEKEKPSSPTGHRGD